jgi:hypothetical protein
VDVAKSILLKLDREGSHIDFDTVAKTANLYTGGFGAPLVVTKIDVGDLLSLFEHGWVSRYESSATEHRYRITGAGRIASQI